VRAPVRGGGDIPLPGLDYPGKNVVTAISMEGSVNTPPLILPWAGHFPLSLPPLLTLESLALS
jgi:hypothetical protein